MTIREAKFDEWQWEEELTVFTLEHVGFGKYFTWYMNKKILCIHNTYVFSFDNQCGGPYDISYCIHIGNHV